MDRVLETLGKKIDAALDTGDALAIKALVEKCREKRGQLKGAKKAMLFFFEANCYSGLAQRYTHKDDYAWSWHQDEKFQEVLCLRKAILEPGFAALLPIYKCKIFTNLASGLNQFGRCIGAIEYWDSALTIMPNFAMALGNKGEGLIYYGHSLYDYSHSGIFVQQANEILQKALSKGALWDGGLDPRAEAAFQMQHDESAKYLEKIEFDKDFKFDQFPLGDTEAEIAYRTWCLSQRLYLNPLNDIMTLSVAAQDVIHLPSHTYKIAENPRFPSYFNLLKQEYTSARYMLYEGISLEGESIADHDVLLLNAFDGVQFGHRNELLKSSYRIAYSVFDKVALFLNDYYSLDIPAQRVSMRGIWSEKKKGGKLELRGSFNGNKNWALRGLYYLSKDLFDDAFMESSMPEARDLARLRNFAEHRFLSIQEYPADVVLTDFHNYITVEDLVKKSLKMLQMSREALIYLSLAMHREEEIRGKDKDLEKVCGHVKSIAINRNDSLG